MSEAELEQKRIDAINTRMTQLTDHLFDKGFEVNRPLMWAAAEWFIGIEKAIYDQGVIKGKSQCEESTDV